MTAEPSPEQIEFDAQLRDIAGSVAELVASKASREGRPIDQGDFVRGAMGLVGSAYCLAKLGGHEALRGYVELLRKHADAVDYAQINRNAGS